MKIKKYQKWTREAINYGVSKTSDKYLYLALGLAGEAGEVANEVKRAFENGKQLDKSKVIDELGDVFWYVTRMADEYNLTLQELASKNYDKLIKRKSNGN